MIDPDLKALSDSWTGETRQDMPSPARLRRNLIWSHLGFGADMLIVVCGLVLGTYSYGGQSAELLLLVYGFCGFAGFASLSAHRNRIKAANQNVDDHLKLCIETEQARIRSHLLGLAVGIAAHFYLAGLLFLEAERLITADGITILVPAMIFIGIMLTWTLVRLNASIKSLLGYGILREKMGSIAD